MSGPAENRWQRPQGRGNNRNSTPAANAPGKDGGRQQSVSAGSGNAWKGKATGEHRPVKDFNSGEVRDFLRKRYLEAVADQPAVYHKVQGDSVATRSSGAWGAKAGNMSHLMPNGQDFFTQLKKQLSTLEKGK
ncbi:hypothetical protein P280DRAFT_393720 [Massarina eburnea CBS 473.64]|uniref:Uncharacterized protein n=1 Tax=Massarina eburnea CBS 473.64 TaxID=1395130 RepID=A0A6A6S713_9PLEO|nr:hypothetical protein P280DRAFT_393720 [Massarina eburnea CBS 473.64]